MNEASRNMIVGLTAIAGLVILGYLIIMFGEVPRWVTDSYPLAIHFKDASGIASGTRVRLNGIDIGYVERVELKEPSYKGVVVRSQIESKYRIPESAMPTASAGLLGGGAQLNIRTEPPPQGEDEKFLSRDGTAELVGQTANLGEELTQVAGRLEENLRTQLEKFGEMADEFTAAARDVRSLLEERDLADVEAGKAEGNLRTMIVHADQRLMEMRETLEGINALVGEEMRQEVRGALADVRGLTQDGREKLSILTERLTTTFDELDRTLHTTNTMLAEAKEGQGTLGRLVQDPQLYNAMTDAARRLTDTLNEAKLLIQKWKAEGVPFKF